MRLAIFWFLLIAVTKSSFAANQSDISIPTVLDPRAPRPTVYGLTDLDKVIWVNGDKYQDALIDGKREGNGKYVFSNGDKYHGEWKDDKFNGFGIYSFKEAGDCYCGLWYDGKRWGEGTYSWKSKTDDVSQRDSITGNWLEDGFASGRFREGKSKKEYFIDCLKIQPMIDDISKTKISKVDELDQ